MHRTDTVVIGAGQAGVALSRCLSDAGRDHVVLDRGRLGERWRTERWDSLRLLTPNWMSRLPAWRYTGDDADGFMTAGAFVRHLERYAASFVAPVREDTRVESVAQSGDGYRVDTTGGSWSAANVVVASGVEGAVRVPDVARDLARSIRQLPSSSYRNPDGIAAGGVLVVGSSATGVQIADELARSGRRVVLASSGHTRVPRRYRGSDIFWWLDRSGSFDTTIDRMPDRAAARRAPSLQLVGRPDHARLDLGVLQERGVEVVGALRHADGTRVGFAGDLDAFVAAADRRMHRTLDGLDRLAHEEGLDASIGSPDRPPPIAVGTPRERIDLRAAGIETVVWATGFTRSYPWLHVPVVGADGEIAHWKGVTGAPGVYVLGLRFQHYRNSNFIDGVGRDAAYVARHIVTRTSKRREVAA